MLSKTIQLILLIAIGLFCVGSFLFAIYKGSDKGTMAGFISVTGYAIFSIPLYKRLLKS